jgi:NADPH:quinone reductase-like Zn-dependent oxidoreductase
LSSVKKFVFSVNINVKHRICDRYVRIDTSEERNIVHKPPFLSHEEAAASGLGLLTAWHAIVEKGGLKVLEETSTDNHPKKVLLIGASGGTLTFYAIFLSGISSNGRS